MKLILLVSGGIDSAVSSYFALKEEGSEAIAVHFENYPFAEGKSAEKVKKILSLLAKKQNKKIKFYLIQHSLSLQEIAKKTERKYCCVLCRRQMLRTAEKIAEKEEAKAIVTGESLGQVASQTLQNLKAEDTASKIPILRPLIGLDKIEIEKIAKELQTYEISIMPPACCNIAPDKPSTQARKEAIEAEEKKLNLEEITRKEIESATVELIE